MPRVQPPPSCKVYTPSRLARAMVEVINEQNRVQRWLEPSCGRNAFIKAIRDLNIPRAKIVGVDLDVRQSKLDCLGMVSRGKDFFSWSKRRTKRFDCVVGNPPYVAINRLAKKLQKSATEIPNLDGSPIGLGANTWYPFLIQSIRMLRDQGNLAFVLPASCEFSNYSEIGRINLTSMFDRVDFIRSQKPLFEGVSDGSVILICRNKGGKSRLFRRHEVADIDSVIERLGKLDSTNAKACPVEPKTCKIANTKKCSEVFEVRIGGVTGDASYFVMPDSRRKELGLPISAMTPVVSKARQITFPLHNLKSWQSQRENDERVWLFRPRGKWLKHKKVAAYLKLTVAKGGCNKKAYKIQNRSPWYSTPLPENVDGFISGMSSAGLWMCMNEMPNLVATNTIYVTSFVDDLARAQKYAWALSLMTSTVNRQTKRSTRTYADGLSKIEPGEIEDLMLPIPPKIPNAVSLYRKVCRLYLNDQKLNAIKMADDLILK